MNDADIYLAALQCPFSLYSALKIMLEKSA